MHLRVRQPRRHGTEQEMKRQRQENADWDSESEYVDMPPDVPAHIEYLSRRWADEDERHNRQPRRGVTRRRIEDWRDEYVLRRQLEDDFYLE